MLDEHAGNVFFKTFKNFYNIVMSYFRENREQIVLNGKQNSVSFLFNFYMLSLPF